MRSTLRLHPWAPVPVFFVLFVVAAFIGGASWGGAILLALVATTVGGVLALFLLRALTGVPRRS
jgi:hypothetical protein